MIKTLSLALFIWSFAFCQGVAQILHSPVNTALGGGGTAYTTGYESLFINPANLFIQEKNYRFQVSTGSAGIYLSSPVKRNDFQSFWDNYQLQTTGFDPSSHSDMVHPAGFDEILNRNYGTGRLFSEHQSRGEIHWLGMHWSRLGRSYALGVRSRFGNRFVTGRNYYDPDPVELTLGIEYSRDLTHQFQSLHEVSFGYAESFTFINGLIPQISQLIIGIAPKFVVSGAYSNTTYKDRFSRDYTDSEYERVRSYNHYTSGVFAEMDQRFATGHDPFNPVTERMDLFTPTGFGAGLDLGVTYLITLGDDFSVVQVSDPTTRKSLRISLSITDVGFVNYFDNPNQYRLDETITIENQLPDRSETLFLGRPGEQLRFLDDNQVHPIFHSDFQDNENFSVLLPTAIHGGVLFQVNRIKLMGDLSFGLTDNAFNTTRLTSYLGTEIRPLPFLPLRAGARISRNLSDYFSMGGGIETRYFDLNLAFQFKSNSVGPANEIEGISVAGLKIYIP